jgi:hypothetical protein
LGSGAFDPLFLTSALDGGEWAGSRHGRFTSRGKNPLNPMCRRLGGPQILSEYCGEETNCLLLPGIETRPRRDNSTLNFKYIAFVVWTQTSKYYKTMHDIREETPLLRDDMPIEETRRVCGAVLHWCPATVYINLMSTKLPDQCSFKFIVKSIHLHLLRLD